MITEAEFRALAAQGFNRIPLVEEVFADLDTPLSLYLKLANARYSFLLESVVGGERFGRYSFIGLPAKVRLRARGQARRGVRRRAACTRRSTATRSRSSSRTARASAPRRCPSCRASAAASPASSATTSCATSRRSSRDTGKPPTPGLADVPDLLLLLTEELAVVDNLKGRSRSSSYADPAQPEAYARTRERLAQLAPQAARAGDDSARDRRHAVARAKPVRRGGLQGSGRRAPRSTSPPATSCRW